MALTTARSAHYPTISAEEAKAGGYRAITFPYGIRRNDQMAMLDTAIRNLRGKDFKLVKKGETIIIYRK